MGEYERRIASGELVAGELACSPMVGRSSGTLPTRVQILVLASFSEIFLGFIGVTR